MKTQAPHSDPECPFCQNLAGHRQCAFVSRSETVSSFVNPRQYRPGATLVIPNRHAETVFDVTPEEWRAVMTHAQQIAAAACAAFGTSGVNIFQNNGPSAGQTVSHLHVHVVPRPEGDVGGAIFGEAFFNKTPMQERLAIADRIREHLPEPTSSLADESLAALRQARAQLAVATMQRRAQETGADKMTLDDINAEIAEIRGNRSE